MEFTQQRQQSCSQEFEEEIVILDDADDGCQEGGNVATRSDGGVSVSAPSRVAVSGSANDGNGDLQRSVFGKKKKPSWFLKIILLSP